MITQGTVRSTCDLCARGCGVLIHISNGNPVKIQGDPESPTNRGIICEKGYAALEYLRHPDRLKYPLMRVGKRGEGRWQRVSWDQALEQIADAMTKAKAALGAESVAFMHGAAKGYGDSYLARLAYVFGSPNVAWQGHVCAVPRFLAKRMTYGFRPEADFSYPPSTIIVWGSNSEATLVHRYEKILAAHNKGAKLLVIDPRKTQLAQKADLWLRPRPGSDLALALGIIHVILEQELYDRDFVKNWTIGFDALKEHLRDYSPKTVAEITWLEADKIEAAAQLYAKNKPSCIQDGNGLDHNLNSFQAGRAISILQAITGNLGVPGGEVDFIRPALMRRKSPELELWKKLPDETWARRVGTDLKLLPTLRYVTSESVMRAIGKEEPYPIRVLYIQGCNSLLTHSNASYVHRTLQKLDFLAVADLFMTPTAALADVVLPAASFLEYDSIFVLQNAQVQQKVAQISECRSDHMTLRGLAEKLRLEDFFRETEERCLDDILKPSGLTFKELKQIGFLPATKTYRRYLASGFETPSRKVELYSTRLEEWGFDPLPTYKEPSETLRSSPELVEEYPLTLTSWKSPVYYHSGGRQIPSLRRAHPDPLVEIHPATAEKEGIEENDWVSIETKRGRITQKATLSKEIDPRIIVADFGWWFPEKDVSTLHGWAESNINILTNHEPPFSPEMGSTHLRGMLCKISRAVHEK